MDGRVEGGGGQGKGREEMRKGKDELRRRLFRPWQCVSEMTYTVSSGTLNSTIPY